MKYIILSILMTTVGIANSQQITSGDILNAKIYTLDNGLKVYITENKTEPKVQTYIAVKAGSKFDPSETTGLAHYLEHLMFKGTPNLATIDWEKEKVLLKKIEDLYEKHKAEQDPEKKKEIYAEIDKVSYEASAFAVPNEYDKLITSIGGQGTNAYTSNDQTVYINTIPSNELEKWMKLESERFQHLVMRLFHTELEAVYEEYNISQDNDGRWAYANLLKALFPNHPYGTQTTIGEGDHLKNPSMINIRNYFDKYYVPNNVAICLSGDIDADETFELVKKYFGEWKSKDIEPFTTPHLPKITAPISIENFGPQEEFLYVGYRIPPAGDKEIYKAELIDYILTNGTAGIIDIDLVQKQQVLAASSFLSTMHDRSVFLLYGKPKQGQTLEEVRDILLAQTEKIKNGEFEDWLIEAAINDIELTQIKNYENNGARAHTFVTAFTENVPWDQFAGKIKYMRTLSKQDLVDFAKRHYKTNNYAVSYKRKGEANNPKVDKPKITPVQLNRDTSSKFYKEMEWFKSPDVKPQFIDYGKEISTQLLPNGVKFYSVKNKENNYAKYCLIFPFGKEHDKDFALASSYFQYLGTAKMSAEDFNEEMYRNGLKINSNVQNDQLIFTLSGLEQNFEKGLELLYDKIMNCTVNSEAWNNMVKDVLEQRKNAKTNKRDCFRALSYYAKYGPKNSYNSVYSNEELQGLDPEQIVKKIHALLGFQHDIFFYGKDKALQMDNASKYNLSKKMLSPAPKKLYDFSVKNSDENTLIVYDYPEMVQAQIIMHNKGQKFDKTTIPYVTLYNDFFGAGLSSIVFQELREQKALAYSAYSYLSTPSEKDDEFALQSFIGTQADKMPVAAKELKALLNKTPEVEIQFNNSKESALKKISSSRKVRDNIFWNYLKLKKLGIDYDIDKESYSVIQNMDLEKFSKFFNENISNKKYNTAIMGDKNALKLDEISDFGKAEFVDSKAIFGY